MENEKGILVDFEILKGLSMEITDIFSEVVSWLNVEDSQLLEFDLHVSYKGEFKITGSILFEHPNHEYFVLPHSEKIRPVGFYTEVESVLIKKGNNNA